MFQKDNNKNVSSFVKTLGKQSDQVPDRLSLSPKRDQHKDENEIKVKNLCSTQQSQDKPESPQIKSETFNLTNVNNNINQSKSPKRDS